jgi:hypothetical protein
MGQRVPSGKSLRQVRKTIPNKCLLTSCLTARLSIWAVWNSMNLSFVSQTETQSLFHPLVTGLRRDLLHLWATFHRANSVPVNCSKSSCLFSQAHSLEKNSFLASSA